MEQREWELDHSWVFHGEYTIIKNTESRSTRFVSSNKSLFVTRLSDQKTRSTPTNRAVHQSVRWLNGLP
jgi:hypothetical protein